MSKARQGLFEFAAEENFFKFRWVANTAKLVWRKLPKTWRGITRMLLVLVFLAATTFLVYILWAGDAATRQLVEWGSGAVVSLWVVVALVKLLLSKKIPGKLWRVARRVWSKLEKAIICLALICGAVSLGWYLYYYQQWQTQVVGGVLGLWLVICVLKGFVGVITPSQGLLIRFGKAVKAVGAGWYPVFYPFERLWSIPTSQYPPLVYQIKRRIYAKASKVLSPQLLEVIEVSIYLQLPMVGGAYHIAGAPRAVSGEELLVKYCYPRRPMRGLFGIRAWRKWWEHLEPVVMGVAGNILSAKTTKECNEDRGVIAGQIKDGLFSGVGNQRFVGR